MSYFYGWIYHVREREACGWQSAALYGLFTAALSFPYQEEFVACLIFEVIRDFKVIFYYQLAFIMWIILFFGFKVASFSKSVTTYYGQLRSDYQ
jgi:hypothetical protein